MRIVGASSSSAARGRCRVDAEGQEIAPPGPRGTDVLLLLAFRRLFEDRQLGLRDSHCFTAIAGSFGLTLSP